MWGPRSQGGEDLKERRLRGVECTSPRSKATRHGLGPGRAIGKFSKSSLWKVDSPVDVGKERKGTKWKEQPGPRL